jgi:hypothetical protein
VVELAPFDGLRVLEVETREGLGEPVHLAQQWDHYEELRGDMLSCCFPSLALVVCINLTDAVDEEGGLALTHDGINDVDHGHISRRRAAFKRPKDGRVGMMDRHVVRHWLFPVLLVALEDREVEFGDLPELEGPKLRQRVSKLLK